IGSTESRSEDALGSRMTFRPTDALEPTIGRPDRPTTPETPMSPARASPPARLPPTPAAAYCRRRNAQPDRLRTRALSFTSPRSGPTLREPARGRAWLLLRLLARLAVGSL